MKTTLCSLLGLAVALMFTGCSTPGSVSQLKGQGSSVVYNSSFDRVWSAAIAASQTGDLYILNADKSQGYISAKRGLRPETFGENVAIWVRVVSPTQTEVEVVSRQAGPPVLMSRNWEKRILSSIAANLTT
jgi:hypothetical protein